MTTEARPQVPYRFEDRVPAPMDSHAAQDAFGKARGWRAPRGNHPCLRWVAGRRCLMGTGRRCGGCVDTLPLTQVLDHSRTWITGDGGRALLGEPYDMGTEGQDRNLAALTETAAELGLIVEELPELSVWYPPYTSPVLVRLPSVEV